VIAFSREAAAQVLAHHGLRCVVEVEGPLRSGDQGGVTNGLHAHILPHFMRLQACCGAPRAAALPAGLVVVEDGFGRAWHLNEQRLIPIRCFAEEENATCDGTCFALPLSRRP